MKGTRVIYRRSQVLTALEFVGFLSVGGWWDADVNDVVARRLIVRGPIRDLLLGDDAVDLCKESRRLEPRKTLPAASRTRVRASRQDARTQERGD